MMEMRNREKQRTSVTTIFRSMSDNIGKMFNPSMIFESEKSRPSRGKRTAALTRVEVKHAPKLPSEYLERMAGGSDSKNIVLNVLVYDYKTGTYYPSFPVFVERESRVRNLKNLLIKKFYLDHKRSVYFVYIGKLRVDEATQLDSVDLVNGDTLVFKPRRVKFPKEKSLESDAEGVRMRRWAKGPRRSMIRSIKDEIRKKNHLDIIPKFNREYYKTSPSYTRLCRMTPEELSRVKNFSVWSKYGKIDFLEEVDLRGLDLDKTLVIAKKCIEVYPEDYFTLNEKPKPGSEINVPAILTFNNMSIRDINENKNKFSRFRNWISALPFVKRSEFNMEEDSVILHVRHF